MNKTEKRKETIDNSTGLICKIGKDIKISVDLYQFILDNKGRITYHHNLISVLNELLESKSKELMVTSKQKTLLSVKMSIENAQKWMEDIVEPLLGYKK